MSVNIEQSGHRLTSEEGWTVRSAARDITGTRYALIERGLDRVVVVVEGREPLRFGSVVRGAFPGDLSPTVLALDAAGRLAVGGTRRRPVGAGDQPERSDVGGGAEGGELVCEAVVVDVDGGEWGLPSDPSAPWTRVLASAASARGPVLLLDRGAPSDVVCQSGAQLVSGTADGFATVPVPLPPDDAGGHHVLATSSGPLAITSGSEGVMATGAGHTTWVADGIAAGAFVDRADIAVVVVRDVDGSSPDTVEVITRRGRPGRGVPRPRHDHRLRADDVAVVAVVGAPGERIVESVDVGHRLVLG